MKIVCIGRNYAAHAQELANNIPTEPIIFLKPQSALHQGDTILLNNRLGIIHYEAELVFKVKKVIAVGEKIKSVDEICKEYTVGIDFTARALQERLKSKGLPWELAKSFDQSALLGDWRSIPNKAFETLSFSLHQNNKLVQSGQASEMIFDLVHLVNFCTDFFSFQPGDLIFTGTPQGVGAVEKGDHYEGFLDGERVLSTVIA